jgi:hypothetical protein
MDASATTATLPSKCAQRLEVWRHCKSAAIRQFAQVMLLPKEKHKTHVLYLDVRYYPEQYPNDFRIPETVFRDCHVTCTFPELYLKHPELKQTIAQMKEANPDSASQVLLLAGSHGWIFSPSAPGVLFVFFPLLVFYCCCPCLDAPGIDFFTLLDSGLKHNQQCSRFIRQVAQ